MNQMLFFFFFWYMVICLSLFLALILDCEDKPAIASTFIAIGEKAPMAAFGLGIDYRVGCLRGPLNLGRPFNEEYKGASFYIHYFFIQTSRSIVLVYLG